MEKDKNTQEFLEAMIKENITQVQVLLMQIEKWFNEYKKIKK